MNGNICATLHLAHVSQIYLTDLRPHLGTSTPGYGVAPITCTGRAPLSVHGAQIKQQKSSLAIDNDDGVPVTCLSHLFPEGPAVERIVPVTELVAALDV